MKTRTIYKGQDTAECRRLYLALELSNTEWKLGFTIGLGQTPRLRTMKSRNLNELKHEIQLAKERFGLSAASDVLACYEAGRDGF